ncbi:MAG: hypothetical protein RLZZ519_1499 [Bacteroidota bacterium]|jgi:hypothetical protein
MKNLVFILVFTAMLPFGLLAQSTVLQSDDGPEFTEPKMKVLVIPFHQLRYYFSDCDKQVGAATKMDVKDVRKAYQLGLDYAAEASMEKNYEPINLAQMKDSVDQVALNEFYDNVSYAYETPTRAMTKKQATVMKAMKERWKQLGGGKEPTTLNEMESYVTVDEEDKEYMKLNWKNGAYLDRLNQMYQPDYIVTVNQFEIKTDYAKCIDRDLGKFARQIKIHYNVFRPDGKQIYGDVITAKYNSATDDFNKIVQDNFGFLGDYITQSLPGAAGKHKQ